MSKVDDLKKEVNELKMRIKELEEENNALKAGQKPLDTRPYRHPGTCGV